jgi:glycosyltransferase involved in cell wall biosynthesis
LVIVKLWRLFRKLRPDIIHTHKSKAGATGRVAAFLYRYCTFSTLLGKPRRVRVLHTFHGHIFHSYYGRAKTAFFVQIERLLAHMTDCIVTVSKQQEREIRDVYGVGRTTEFRVVPLGVDFSNSYSGNEFRQTHGIGPEEFLIAAVGRLSEVKNFSLLLQAVALARRTTPPPSIHLAFIGDGHLRPDLEQEARQLGISEAVTFAGICDDVDAIYREGDLTALSSLNEGTPLVLIEAMGQGRAVLMTEVGGYQDILGELLRTDKGFKVWTHGVSVGSGDLQGYASALAFLHANPELRQQMGEAARGYSWHCFSRKRLVEDMAGLYQELWSPQKLKRRVSESAARPSLG